MSRASYIVLNHADPAMRLAFGDSVPDVEKPKRTWEEARSDAIVLRRYLPPDNVVQIVDVESGLVFNAVQHAPNVIAVLADVSNGCN